MADLSLLAEAAHGAAEHAEVTALGLTAAGWWAITVLALFVLMIFLKVPSIVASMLDKKIDGIRQMLNEASTLRAEAEALRHEYADKVANVEKDAAAMLDHAKREAEAIVAKAETDAANVVARREKIAEEKIAAAERAAVDELRVKAADAAAAAARRLIGEKHSAEADKTLVDHTIGEI